MIESCCILAARLGWKADPEVLLDRDHERKGKRAGASESLGVDCNAKGDEKVMR